MSSQEGSQSKLNIGMMGCALGYGSLHLPFLPSLTIYPSLSSQPLVHAYVPSSAPLSLAALPKESICQKVKALRFSCCSSSNPHASGFPVVDNVGGFIVVNFYRFVFIEDPHFEVSRQLSFLEGLDIHGRIYLNKLGINAQLSGPSRDALAYVEWLREDPRFSEILVQISPSYDGHAFPRLKLRYKPSMVQFDLGVQDLPLSDPSMRATPLSPAEWKKRLTLLNHCNNDASHEDQNKNCILLDVRNGYEWDIGHFHGAQRPEVDCFKSTSYGLSDIEVIDSDPLKNVDKEKADILMYCTGGIRCDVYSTILRQKGFKNMYTLKGGVSHYLANEGPEKWIGNLFVFDTRLSLPPSTFKSGSTTESRNPEAVTDSKFARCHICASQIDELRHRNCANLDCNLLYLCCRNCMQELRGCCCPDCKSAPRLRPALLGNNVRYKKWHIYRDNERDKQSLGM